MDDDIQKEIVKQTGEVLKEGYNDLIHPSAEAVGQIISYLPRTVRIGLSKWEKWLVNGEESLRLTGEALREKVDKIPEDKLCEPEPYVAIPAMQQIAYCYDSEELREMYANLLASSMNEDKKWDVHPGFVDIIKQMVPDEAKILKISPSSSFTYIPLIDLNIKTDGKRGARTIFRNYSKAAEIACENPEKISQYLDNLNRLKLINIPNELSIPVDSYYDELINSKTICDIQANYSLKENEHFDYLRKLYYVTDFGVGFKKCCIE